MTRVPGCASRINYSAAPLIMTSPFGLLRASKSSIAILIPIAPVQTTSPAIDFTTLLPQPPHYEIAQAEQLAMSFVLRARVASGRLSTPACSSSSSSSRIARFSTSPRTFKDPVEAVKDTVKKVDRSVADAAVKGIETGRTFVQFPFQLFLVAALMRIPNGPSTCPFAHLSICPSVHSPICPSPSIRRPSFANTCFLPAFPFSRLHTKH